MTMTSMERVLKTLGHEEPDRVPLFILISFYGAKLLNMSIKDYFSDPENIVRAQQMARDRFHMDCFYAFYYAAIEFEAFGGHTIFCEDGPPTAGQPVIQASDLVDLRPPSIEGVPGLKRVLTSIRKLKSLAGSEIPIAGVVMSPFSLPIMQMGFSNYLDLIISNPSGFEKLMAVNEAFCLEWANAQFDAGVTFLAYFDPMLSTRMMPKSFTSTTGFEIAKRMLTKFKGPAVLHFASGESMDLIDLVLETPALGAAVSCNEPMGIMKQHYRGQKVLVGNINALELIRWTPEEVDNHVRSLMNQAGPGGGFIFSDTHGEIPWQVPEKQLDILSESVKRWGKYPIERLV